MTRSAGTGATVAGQAAPGEQVEAFVGQGTSTTRAGPRRRGRVADLGVVGRHRHPGGPDGRQGFAWAGSLDDDVIAEALAEARDNAALRRARRVGRPGRARRRRRRPTSTCGATAWPRCPPTRKVDLALELERAVKAGDPRISGVRTSTWGDGSGEGAVATSTGIAVAGRSTFCHLSVQRAGRGRRRDADRLRRRRSGREPADIDLAEAAADAVERATRLLGATQPAERRGHRSCSSRAWRRPCSASSAARSTASRCSRAGRRSPSGWASRSPRRCSRSSTTRPTPRRSGADTPRRRGPGHAAATPLIDDGVLQGFLHNTLHRPARRAPLDRLGGARLPLDARASAPRRWP